MQPNIITVCRSAISKTGYSLVATNEDEWAYWDLTLPQLRDLYLTIGWKLQVHDHEQEVLSK
jgi:hypothetical protein